MKYGLSNNDTEKICDVFAGIAAIEKAVLYGSRAIGTHRAGSDIDLTLYGDELTHHMLGDIAEELDDLLLPYMFDLSIYNSLEHEKLREHINRVGVTFYSRSDRKRKGGVMWKTVKLGDAIKLEYGKPLPKEDRAQDGKYIAYGANGPKANTNKIYCNKPSIIVGRKGSAGEVTLVKKPFWPLDVTFFVTFDEQEYDLDFLFYYLKMLNLPSMAKGVKPGINRNDVYALTALFPPLEEQKRIVAVLDEAFEGIDAAIAHTEQNIQNARELFESHLNTIFTQKGAGWVENTLGDVCIFENGDRGKNYPSRSKFVSDGILFINAGHIENGEIDFSSMNYITEESYSLLSRGKVRINDILFCLRGSLGKFARVPSNTEGAIASSLVIIRPKQVLNIEFFLHYLRSGHCKEMITKFAGGAAQPNLGAKDLAKFTISIPDINKQRVAAASMDNVMTQSMALESIYTQKLASLKELKQSLLQKAFTGELTADMQEAA